ncbi:MAG: hypothetical protein K8R55_00995 [Desulfuromonadaceae bacterium]|nr:hypothetical protein [Desulfuromonadaceae bacterium]
MKHAKISWVMALITGAALFATTSLAMEHHSGHDMSGAMDHGNMQPMNAMNHGMGHGQGEMIMLGEEVQEGVKAMVHLMAIDPIIMTADHPATHHLMVMFTDAETGQAIDSGTVAVKIGSPDGKESAPTRLMGMQGHFGADVTLDQPGIWHFRLATKLADGKVRKYHGHHVLK